jgi:hypothetical protein
MEQVTLSARQNSELPLKRPIIPVDRIRSRMPY